MTIPADAINPDAAYEAWVDQYLWHIDQLPNVVETTGTVQLAPRRVRAQQLHERVSGGGYIDNMPVVDGPESRRAAAVWHALRAYLTVAGGRLGVEPPTIPPQLPDDAEVARLWAYSANQWLAELVYFIRDWEDLTALENELFRLIRRAHTGLGVAPVRRSTAELCTTCGEPGVVVDWITAPDGTAALNRACIVCGQTYGGGASVTLGAEHP